MHEHTWYRPTGLFAFASGVVAHVPHLDATLQALASVGAFCGGIAALGGLLYRVYCDRRPPADRPKPPPAEAP